MISQGLPVYRVLYQRNEEPRPELQLLEQWMEAADKQTDNPLDPEAPMA